ncbi:PD-(D/E)XK nuclease family protein [Methanobrevibacter sp.]|uniref:RecB family exonuclease n=1 Tax=Methanobrevibacter sp. TaxID=66852 RepID=UPI0026004C5F|nr:PD-(D/E)XK nuclease family protein [Methanobrevibacter sp.]MBR4448450.1 PD-(D/E)XK nuclease family protein [Methanobrevibacter sp.]
MKLSKSKINSYLKCPLEFKFQYIDEIEAEPNKYMILGSDVHSVAETFADKFGDELDKVDIQNELIKIANDLDIGYDISNHVDNLSIFFKEVFVNNDYKLFSQEEYLLDEKNRFSGICDIILEDENGDLVVIDYKTSNSNSFHKYRRELCYYKLLVENVYDRDVSTVGIFFTKNGRLRLLDVYDEDNKRKFLHSREIDEAIDKFYFVRNEVNKGNFYAKPQYLCRFCTYKDICDENSYF